MTSHVQPQPKAFKLSLNALCSLPRRLCSPPSPTVGKVRSFGVTPVFKVQLQDVLDRKHLPPLGLKDFEEWLLHVEQCPENLYFLLWLREYTTNYRSWALTSKGIPRNNLAEYRITRPTQQSTALGMSYARAKQTFFTPNSSQELDVPSDVLSPFHTSAFVHPDPAAFAEVAHEVQEMLKESLERFVVAAYTNVGTNRGLCGIVGGIALALLGSALPIVWSSTHENSRWLRISALPGLWLGLTVLIASLHGICMMIFIFGDLRQLRKFELTQPPISRPRPLDRRPAISPPMALSPRIAPLTGPSLHPATHTPTPAQLSIPEPVHHRARRISVISSTSHDPSSSGCSGSSYTAGSYAHSIQISPAYYDDEPSPEGPATSTNPSHIIPGKSTTPQNSFAHTASFIHAYDPPSDDEADVSPSERQQVDAFDFDALPPRMYHVRPPLVQRPPGHLDSRIFPEVHLQKGVPLSPKAIILQAQYKCSRKYTLGESDVSAADLEKGSVTRSNATEAFDPVTAKTAPRLAATEERIHARFKMVKAVPAFTSPFTRVLSPVVSRAQWEIVVRSAGWAFLVSWAILGCALALPVKRA